jgi:mono/diheme cytochrome c family protein
MSKAMKTTATIPTLLLAALAGAGLAGCQGDREDKPPRQFFPDMDDSPKFKPQVRSDFFADGRSMRPAVDHTVAFGRGTPDRDILIGKPDWYAKFHGQRQALLREQWEVYEGAVPKVDAAGNRVIDPAAGVVFEKVADRIPVEVNEKLLARGQERFNIYCAVCHGYEADGKGMVGDLSRATGWVGGARNLHEAPYRDPASVKSKDGYVFWVARNGFINGTGKPMMPGYAHALSAEDTWAIVAWLRVLQETRAVPQAEVPKDAMDKISGSRPAPAASGNAGGKP